MGSAGAGAMGAIIDVCLLDGYRGSWIPSDRLLACTAVEGDRMLFPGPRIGSGSTILGGEGKGVVIRDLGAACRGLPVISTSTAWTPVPGVLGVLGVELFDKGEGGLDLCTSFFRPVTVWVRRWCTSFGGVLGGEE